MAAVLAQLLGGFLAPLYSQLERNPSPLPVFPKCFETETLSQRAFAFIYLVHRAPHKLKHVPEGDTVAVGDGEGHDHDNVPIHRQAGLNHQHTIADPKSPEAHKDTYLLTVAPSGGARHYSPITDKPLSVLSSSLNDFISRFISPSIN